MPRRRKMEHVSEDVLPIKTGHMLKTYVPRKLPRESTTYTYGADGAPLSISIYNAHYPPVEVYLVVGTVPTIMGTEMTVQANVLTMCPAACAPFGGRP